MSHEKGIEAAAQELLDAAERMYDHLKAKAGDVDLTYALRAFNRTRKALRALPAAQPTSEAERLMPTEKRLVRRLMETLNIKTCRDHSCVYATEPIKGMGTNGGCRCAGNVESAVFDLMQRTQPTSEGEERVLLDELIAPYPEHIFPEITPVELEWINATLTSPIVSRLHASWARHIHRWLSGSAQARSAREGGKR